MNTKRKAEAYPTVTIESVDGAWILREKGKDAKAFCIWHQLVSELEQRITTNGAKQ